MADGEAGRTLLNLYAERNKLSRRVEEIDAEIKRLRDDPVLARLLDRR